MVVQHVGLCARGPAPTVDIKGQIFRKWLLVASTIRAQIWWFFMKFWILSCSWQILVIYIQGDMSHIGCYVFIYKLWRHKCSFKHFIYWYVIFCPSSVCPPVDGHRPHLRLSARSRKSGEVQQLLPGPKRLHHGPVSPTYKEQGHGFEFLSFLKCLWLFLALLCPLQENLSPMQQNNIVNRYRGGCFCFNKALL